MLAAEKQLTHASQTTIVWRVW